MLFTSWAFLAFFLPISILGYGLACHVEKRAGAIWLVLTSFIFYGFFEPSLVLLLTSSIVFNYVISIVIRRLAHTERVQRAVLITGISINLAALVYYKYSYALLAFIFGFTHADIHGLKAVTLPLGISFFTFTQIGFLVDCKADTQKANGFLEYLLFVTFFPHLIAGPILHHSEMMPQFANAETYKLRAENIGAGLTMFTIGLMKKSLLADNLSYLNGLGFSHSPHIQFLTAWGVVLGYALQLYFDFSGYSDMAIGLAVVFNLRFPPNFNSPYRATNIIDFWQRWHMTLSRYLTMYLYNPIGMSLRRRRIAKGMPMTRRALSTPKAFVSLVALPTLFIMALAGIWHGAGLQFLVFGLLHGVYIVVNQIWRVFGPKSAIAAAGRYRRAGLTFCYFLLTFVAVLIADVFFRASTVGQALQMLSGMFGGHGVEPALTVSKPFMVLTGPFGRWLQTVGLVDTNLSPLHITEQGAYIVAGLLIIFIAPNSQTIMRFARPLLGREAPDVKSGLAWRPSVSWAVAAGCAAVIALLSLGGTTEFLYFQF